MVSYWKTQWFNIVVGTFAFVMFIVNIIQGDGFSACLWVGSSYVWLIMSVVNYNNDRIELLEKKQERDDEMYELVQELVAANKIDRETMKKYEERLKKLEGKK